MLGGEYRHNLDAKNRIFIPAKLREELGASFYITKSIRNKCLQVYSEEGWEEYIKPIRALERKTAEEAMRRLHSTMEHAVPDTQGRVVIDNALLQLAEIGSNAVIVGCGDYAEIWSVEEYEKKCAETDVSELLRKLEELGL